MCHGVEISPQTQNRLTAIYFFSYQACTFFIGTGFGGRSFESTRVQKVYFFIRVKRFLKNTMMVYNLALTAQILILNDCAAEKYCNALNKILSYINDHQVSNKIQ